MAERDNFEARESLHNGERDRADVLLWEADGRLRAELVVTLFGMPVDGAVRRHKHCHSVEVGH